MLDITITIEGDKILIEGLQKLAHEGIPRATQRGLSRIAREVHRGAYAWLSGAGGSGKGAREDYVGFSRGKTVGGVHHSEAVMFRSFHTAGGYPVPVRTGNLRRLLDFVEPGQTKASEGFTFSAAPDEAIVYDSAEYADVIHEGKGSSAKFGPRRYIQDAFELFNRGAGAQQILGEEIRKETKGAGLG